MDVQIVRMAEARCQFLDWQQLLFRKPDLVIRTRAIGHGTAEHLINPVETQIAVTPGILSSKTALNIEIGAADQKDRADIWLVRPGP